MVSDQMLCWERVGTGPRYRVTPYRVSRRIEAVRGVFVRSGPSASDRRGRGGRYSGAPSPGPHAARHTQQPVRKEHLLGQIGRRITPAEVLGCGGDREMCGFLAGVCGRGWMEHTHTPGRGEIAWGAYTRDGSMSRPGWVLVPETSSFASVAIRFHLFVMLPWWIRSPAVWVVTGPSCLKCEQASGEIDWCKRMRRIPLTWSRVDPSEICSVIQDICDAWSAAAMNARLEGERGMVERVEEEGRRTHQMVWV